MTAYTFSQLIDFTRTTAGTFVGSNGLIQNTPASVNLLTFTQEFDNAIWVKSGATVTANATVAPDGTSTADALIENTATTLHAIRSSGFTYTAGQSYVLSVYAKIASGSRFLNLYPPFSIGGNGLGSFNLVSGVAVSTAGTGSVSASINGVGDGWYRCSISFVAQSTATVGNGVFFGLSDAISQAEDVYTGDGTSGIFLWGAQLELGSAPSTYTRNVGGFFPPRFDYDPVTLAPRGLLIEEQRTNFLRYSSEFDNVVWNNASPAIPTITTNTTVAPDGTTTADTLTASVGGTASQSRQNVTSTGTTGNFTGSVFLKAGTSTRSRIILVDTTSGFTLVGDFAIAWSGGVASVQSTTLGTASVTAAGNGWYRCVLTANVPSAGASVAIAVYPDILVGTNSVVAWGAQLEAGAFATSYIPTVASTVTRAADQAVIVAPMFAPWYNQSAGSFLVEVVTFKPTTVAASVIAIDVSDGGINNRDYLGFVSTAAEARTVVGGAVQAVINQNYTANAVEKLAYAVAANDFAFVRNGSLAGTDPSGTIPTVNRMFIGNAAGSAAFLNGHIRSINYYPLRLTNAQLQGLTT